MPFGIYGKRRGSFILDGSMEGFYLSISRRGSQIAHVSG